MTWEHRDPAAEVLVITNMWPDAERPYYGIFVQRQIESVRDAGVRCDVLYLRGYRGFQTYVRASAKLAWSSLAWRGRYRLVHVHAGEAALAARFHLGTPMLASYYGDDLLGTFRPDGRPLRTSLARSAVIRRHAQFFTATITQSTEMEGVLPRPGQRRNHVVPSGVDSAHFKPMGREDARRRLGWDASELVVLFAATKPYDPRKRLWLAEAACRAAEPRVGPLRLHVGDATPDRMPLLMNAADCLLLTSAGEGSPNVVKEALMCNLPVVSTRVGDVESLVVGVAPTRVCEDSPLPLADGLVECLDPPRRSNGRQAAAHVSSGAIAARLLDLYRAVAAPAAAVADAPRGE